MGFVSDFGWCSWLPYVTCFSTSFLHQWSKTNCMDDWTGWPTVFCVSSKAVTNETISLPLSDAASLRVPSVAELAILSPLARKQLSDFRQLNPFNLSCPRSFAGTPADILMHKSRNSSLPPTPHPPRPWRERSAGFTAVSLLLIDSGLVSFRWDCLPVYFLVLLLACLLVSLCRISVTSSVCLASVYCSSFSFVYYVLNCLFLVIKQVMYRSVAYIVTIFSSNSTTCCVIRQVNILLHFVENGEWLL